MSKYCVPAWSREGLPCPHGEKVLLPLSTFTMPSSSTGLDWLAAAFCTLPFDWVLVVLLRGWLVRGLWELALGLLILVAYIVLVALQSGLLHEPRPAASCLCSCGMPSGHAVVCMSLMTFLWCELCSRKGPAPPQRCGFCALDFHLLADALVGVRHGFLGSLLFAA
ncbi:hypothetical protein AK812_SmicGene42075 [Symbiodinium microadriaticum]|uniref:Dolichyldiphosphatase n=1 Tax=Symbiodinium microadriaticum TaxID=2951 RepID=A0A1Q9C4H2_SYMMI|nr:hypothetical protein AK812_SmicGene42075 [Symbiodinium microadriaticum]